MNTTTEVDLSIKELADRARRSTRQINNWKAAAERRLNRKLGYPDPTDRRILRFKPDEAREILRSGMSEEEGQEQPPKPQSPDFTDANSNAEANIFGGMDARSSKWVQLPGSDPSAPRLEPVEQCDD